GTSQYDGTISGKGGFTLDKGTANADLTLTGDNSYEGKTTVESGATLRLADGGSIADSSEVAVAGSFDIAGTDAGASIKTLSGAGDVTLGSEELTITDGSTTFSGEISGGGDLTVSGGEQTLTGENTYTGATTIEAEALLALDDLGSIATSSGVEVKGT